MPRSSPGADNRAVAQVRTPYVQRNSRRVWLSPRDDADFESYVAAVSPRLRRVAYLVVRDWQFAEDVVQEAFVKVYVAWPRLRSQTRDAYVRRAVVNTAVSQTRKRRPEILTGSVPDQAIADPDDRLDQDLVDALRGLSAAQASVLGLRYIDDLSVSAVAEVLGISEGTVKSHTSRAISHLRGFFSDTTTPWSSHD